MGRLKVRRDRPAKRHGALTGIRQRWAVNALSVVMVVILVCFSAFTVGMIGYYYSNLQSSLEAKARTATDFFGSYVSQSYTEYYLSVYQYAQKFEEKDTLELQFINTGGAIISSSFGLTAGMSPGTSDIREAMDSRQIRVFSGRDPSTNERIMAVSSPMVYSNGELVGVLRFVTSLKIVDRQILNAVLAALALAFVVLMLVVFSSRYFIHTIVDPVAEISATAKRIAAGSYGVQIQKSFDDEIGELVDTINDMSIKIAQSEKMQSEFVSSVSHELRTPLTAIAGWSETLLAGEQLDEQTARGIRTILSEARRLTTLVEELLEFTRLQDGRMTLSVEQTDIRAVFEDTVFMYGSRLRQEGIQLEYEDSEADIPELPCDGARMKQVFLNLLDNAVKHGGDGGRIDASIGLEPGFVVIRIRDYGPGVPEDELPLIKKKFYKGNSKSRGSGIGLAVCDEIVSLHAGTLTIANAPTGGCEATIRLPL